MSHRGSVSTRAIVLKRKNIGETDRIVTLLSEDFGKITVIAKGARKLTSAKRGHIEPGNTIDAFLIMTKSMPLLTQTKLYDCLQTDHFTLKQLRKLNQVLEILNVLFIEEEIAVAEFKLITQIMADLKNQHSSQILKEQLTQLVSLLGYGEPTTPEASLTEFVQEITDKKLRSWGFLSV